MSVTRRRTRLPKEVKVGTKVCRVRRKHLPGFYGNYSYTTNDIDLNKDQSPSEERSTLLHECLHAVVSTYGLKVNAGINQQQEEKVVSTLEVALLSLLRDNPQLVRFLCHKD